MGETLRPLKQFDEEEQVRYFYSRERTRSLRDPTKNLFRTHLFGVQETVVDTDGVFGTRDRLITFGTSIAVDSLTAPAGIIMEFGSSSVGTKLALSGTTLFVAAGNATGTDGVDDSVSLASLGEVGAIHDLVLAISPGDGKIRLFVNGDIVIRLEGGEQFVSGVWTDAEDGAIGSAQAGGSSTQRGQTINGTPVDFSLIQRMKVFQGQLPRQFD